MKKLCFKYRLYSLIIKTKKKNSKKYISFINVLLYIISITSKLKNENLEIIKVMLILFFFLFFFFTLVSY